MARRAISASGELTEHAWQAQVIGLARLYGWRIFHAVDNRPAGRTGRPQRLAAPEGKGYPDLTLIKVPRLVVAELKTRTGRLGPGQQEWIAAFHQLGEAIESELTYGMEALNRTEDPSVEAYIWRPADWDEVQAVLGRGMTRRCELDR